MSGNPYHYPILDSMAPGGNHAEILLDDGVEQIARLMYPEIAAKKIHHDTIVDLLDQFSRSTLRRLRTSMRTVLTLLNEEECNKNAKEAGKLHGARAHVPLFFPPKEDGDSSLGSPLPDHCYEDMSALDCLRCEFSKTTVCRLLTLHRLKLARHFVFISPLIHAYCLNYVSFS